LMNEETNILLKSVFV